MIPGRNQSLFEKVSKGPPGSKLRSVISQAKLPGFPSRPARGRCYGPCDALGDKEIGALWLWAEENEFPVTESCRVLACERYLLRSFAAGMTLDTS